MQDISENILQTIKYGIKSALKKLPRDKTFTGTVVKVIDDKQFLVRYDNADRKITTTNSLLLKVGDVVHVTYPLNDSSKKYLEEDIPYSFLGTIITYAGKNAPNGYLLCDGRDLLIFNYGNLAQHIYKEFGSYNYYDTDGSCGSGYFTLPKMTSNYSGVNYYIKY